MTLDEKGACNMINHFVNKNDKSFCKKHKCILTGVKRSIQAKAYYAIIHLFAHMPLDLTLFPNKTMFPLKHVDIFLS